MRKTRGIASVLIAAMTVSSFSFSATAGELENDDAVAGFSAALNSYYAENENADDELLDYLVPLADQEFIPEEEIFTAEPEEVKTIMEATVEDPAEASEIASKQETDKDSVDTVETFADRYNNLTEFLKENKDVSERASSITSALKDASRSVGAFAAIGITADENGKLHVNASRLAASLKDRPESVEYVLGKGGLAGRAKKSIKLATFNQDKLFPSVSSAMGREDNPAKSMYSPKAVTAQNDFNDRGSMLNLYS